MEIAGVEIMDAADLGEPNSLMFFGYPKRGKTTLAGSIINVPGYERVLFIDLEAGTAPVARKYPGCKVARFGQFDTNSVATLLNALYETEAGDEFDCVVLDTVSTLQQWLIEAWLSTHKTASGKLDFDGWEYVRAYIMDVMWKLHYMAPLGISLYHTRTDQNELTKEIWTVPFLQGSARNSVASVPDLVGYLNVNGAGKRILQITPRPTMTTGSRFEDVLKDTTIDADSGIGALFDQIRA